MTHLERFKACMNYGAIDRPYLPRFMSHPWPETEQRWLKEGWHPGDDEKFPFDHWIEHWKWFFPNPPFEEQVIEEKGGIRLRINHEGILMRERTDNPMSSMPQFVRFPVETREDFRRFWRERMRPNMEGRLGEDWAAMLEGMRDRDAPLCIFADRWGGFFGSLRNMVGVERLCMLFYDDPAFLEEMMEAEANFMIAVMDRILDHVTVDAFGFWEDMAYKTGPLVGPQMFRKYALPRYRRVVEHLSSRGVEFFWLDSDGSVWDLIPIWLDAGITIIVPFEVQAGMDVVEVRRRFGKELRMWGGFDKRAIAQGPKAIDAEIERLRPLVYEGGYIVGADHSIPPDTSWADFQYYAEHLLGMVK